MIVSKENIVSLIPQRAPFIMIDTLVHADEMGTTTGFSVQNDNIFTTDAYFREPGLVENIAQTAAAGEGFRALLMKRPVAVGYIGSVKNLLVFELPKTGDTLETTVAIQHKVFDVTVITGRIKCNGRLIATCEMKIFLNQ